MWRGGSYELKGIQKRWSGLFWQKVESGLHNVSVATAAGSCATVAMECALTSKHLAAVGITEPPELN